MARKALLLVILVQVLGVLAAAAAARPLPLEEGGAGGNGSGGWMAGSIGTMVTQLLLGSKSGSNPKSHCC
ncbi:hypothetical protein HU200_001352 [Digitaria exilis]|uniref:Uncharacterized protein n=1 Tax=Digitaria exilis TaxID=1010633 RepID=A0A835KWL4_9POAL|nr:hypothetical protein HU200_001352 [Digitaria exilis]